MDDSLSWDGLSPSSSKSNMMSSLSSAEQQPYKKALDDFALGSMLGFGVAAEAEAEAEADINEANSNMLLLYDTKDDDPRHHFGAKPNSYSNHELLWSDQNFQNHDKGTHPNFGVCEFFENQQQKQQNPRSDKQTKSAKIDFQRPETSTLSRSSYKDKEVKAKKIADAWAKKKQMMYYEAAFRPVNFGLEVVEKKKARKNVKISIIPQTVAARKRRERISHKLRILQSLVPGGKTMDIPTMLDEAANYLKFLRTLSTALENFANTVHLPLILP